MALRTDHDARRGAPVQSWAVGRLETKRLSFHGAVFPPWHDVCIETRAVRNGLHDSSADHREGDKAAPLLRTSSFTAMVSASWRKTTRLARGICARTRLISKDKSFWKCLAFVAASAVSGLYVLYVTLGNLALSTQLVRNVISSGQHGANDLVVLEYDSAWTLWPGQVHVDGFRLRIEDYNLQLGISAAELDLDLVLHDLFSRRAHAETLRATGVSVKLRHKVKTTKGQRARVAAFPRIEGFTRPPVYHGKRSPPKDPNDQSIWTLHADRAHLGVRELWLVEYRFRGHATAEGGFVYRPGLHLTLDRTELDFRLGKITAGRHTVARELTGTIAAHVEDFDARRGSLQELVDDAEIETKLQHRIAGLDFLNLYLEREGIEARGGEGELKLTAKNVDGVLSRHSFAQYTTQGFQLAFRGQQDRPVLSFHRVDTELRVERNGEPSSPHLAARLEVDHTTLHSDVRDGNGNGNSNSNSNSNGNVPEAVERYAVLDALDVRLRTKSAQPLTGFDVKEAHVDFDQATVDNLHELVRAFDPELARSIRGGSLTIRGSFGYRPSKAKSERRFEGKLRSEFQNVAVHLGNDIRLSLTGHTEARFRGSQVTRLQIQPLAVQFKYLGLRRTPARNAGEDTSSRTAWWATLKSDRAQILGFDPLRFRASFDLNAMNAEPLFDFFVRSSVAGAIADVLLDFDPTSGSLKVSHDEHVTSIEVDRFDSGSVQMRGSWQATRRGEYGRFLVSTGPLNWGVELKTGGVSVDSLAGDDWLSETP